MNILQITGTCINFILHKHSCFQNVFVSLWFGNSIFPVVSVMLCVTTTHPRLLVNLAFGSWFRTWYAAWPSDITFRPVGIIWGLSWLAFGDSIKDGLPGVSSVTLIWHVMLTTSSLIDAAWRTRLRPFSVLVVGSGVNFWQIMHLFRSAATVSDSVSAVSFIASFFLVMSSTWTANVSNIKINMFSLKPWFVTSNALFLCFSFNFSSHFPINWIIKCDIFSWYNVILLHSWLYLIEHVLSQVFVICTYLTIDLKKVTLKVKCWQISG